MATNKIYYLCSSPDDSGVTMACELPDDYTSYGRMLVLSEKDDPNLKDAYQLVVRHKGQHSTMTVQRDPEASGFLYRGEFELDGVGSVDVVFEMMVCLRLPYVGNCEELQGLYTIGEVVDGVWIEELFERGILLTGF